MMGHHCLRATARGAFAATIDRPTGDLVAKLPRQRVEELGESADDLPFAPGGRAFREWVQIPAYDTNEWGRLIDDSIEFVADGA